MSPQRGCQSHHPKYALPHLWVIRASLTDTPPVSAPSLFSLFSSSLFLEKVIAWFKQKCPSSSQLLLNLHHIAPILDINWSPSPDESQQPTEQQIQGYVLDILLNMLNYCIHSVVILENLQWADDHTWAILPKLLQVSPPSPTQFLYIHIICPPIYLISRLPGASFFFLFPWENLYPLANGPRRPTSTTFRLLLVSHSSFSRNVTNFLFYSLDQ